MINCVTNHSPKQKGGGSKCDEDNADMTNQFSWSNFYFTKMPLFGTYFCPHEIRLTLLVILVLSYYNRNI